jgi:serine/threonine protein kinase
MAQTAGATAQELLASVRFTLGRKIAEGGMGAVHEAILPGPEGFETVVAIKLIKESLASDPEFLEKFVGEAKLVADLVHQNIVQTYQLGRVGRVLYMAMEYVDGVNLFELSKRHAERGTRIPVDLCVYLASRVCRGLEYAHKKTDRAGNPLHVVHRDVSPKNVLMSREGFVKLGDFGIAKAQRLMKDEEGEVLLGKARYMSPEQARYGATDGRSDLFSLGIMLHEMLLGTPLFQGENTDVILEAVAKKAIPSVRSVDPSIPADVDRILTRALERDVSRRYPDAGTMAYELEHFIYHDRFGPTVVTVEKHLIELFPERFGPRK